MSNVKDLAEWLFDVPLDDDQCEMAESIARSLQSDDEAEDWGPVARSVTEPRLRLRLAGASPRGLGRDVLVVEDNPVNQAVAVRMLENGGFCAHVASDGRQALDRLAERSYAAVLMECLLPELDGYATAREIRRREGSGRRTPIIATTSGSMPGERERCLASGMDDYLSKPLRNRQLDDALGRWVPAVEQLLHEAIVVELEHLEGNMLTTLVGMYFEEIPKRLFGLGTAIAREDTEMLRQAAHQMRGGSSAVSACGWQTSWASSKQRRLEVT